METYLKTLSTLEPGDNAGVLLKGLKREDLRRGMAIVEPNTIIPSIKGFTL